MEQDVFDFWKFLAGIGIFLWGMNQLEHSIKELAGKSFRGLLQKSTDTALKGILVGALITAVLQSSSLVTLMVLAFLGAGAISLRNSIGIILGANLGTTITAWIVATLGFKLSIATFAMPFLGLGSLIFLFAGNRAILKNIGAFAVGFGFLFLGLDFMKSAIEAIADQVDLSQFNDRGLWIYLIIGIVITALIQSSSAMVVIILSGIDAGVLGLMEGAVLIIGSNIGTTVTVGLGAFKGLADKKRLALFHFLFNVITGLVIFIFIVPIIHGTMHVFSIKDPLIELVLFNSLMNMLGILMFFPFISIFEKWLKTKFSTSESEGISAFTKNVSVKVPEAAIAALEKDIQLGFHKTTSFILQVWTGHSIKKNNRSVWKKIIVKSSDLLDQYKQIKDLEDELIHYHIALQEENLTLKEAQKLTSLMLGLRTMVYAAKDLKDVLHNIRDMEEEDDPLVHDLYNQLGNYAVGFVKRLEDHLQMKTFNDPTPDWFSLNAAQYAAWINEIYSSIKINQIEYPVSTLNNVIKQVISSLDNLGSAVIHWKHQKKEVIDTLAEFPAVPK